MIARSRSLDRLRARRRQLERSRQRPLQGLTLAVEPGAGGDHP